MKTKEDEIWYFRQKLRPIVAEVMNRLQSEENRREFEHAIKQGKRDIKPCGAIR